MTLHTQIQMDRHRSINVSEGFSRPPLYSSHSYASNRLYDGPPLPPCSSLLNPPPEGPYSTHSQQTDIPVRHSPVNYNAWSPKGSCGPSISTPSFNDMPAYGENSLLDKRNMIDGDFVDKPTSEDVSRKAMASSDIIDRYFSWVHPNELLRIRGTVDPNRPCFNTGEKTTDKPNVTNSRGLAEDNKSKSHSDKERDRRKAHGEILAEVTKLYPTATLELVDYKPGGTKCPGKHHLLLAPLFQYKFDTLLVNKLEAEMENQRRRAERAEQRNQLLENQLGISGSSASEEDEVLYEGSPKKRQRMGNSSTGEPIQYRADRCEPMASQQHRRMLSPPASTCGSSRTISRRSDSPSSATSEHVAAVTNTGHQMPFRSSLSGQAA